MFIFLLSYYPRLSLLALIASTVVVAVAGLVVLATAASVVRGLARGSQGKVLSLKDAASDIQ